MLNLKDKVVLITGSSIGIGRYTAYEFAKENSINIITYHKDKEEAIKTYHTCLNLGMPEGMVLHLNLKDNKSIKNCVKQVIDKYKRML